MNLNYNNDKYESDHEITNKTKYITLYFRLSGESLDEGCACYLGKATYDEKVEEVIKRYITHLSVYKKIDIDKNNYRFIYNAKNLGSNPFITVAEAELSENANIFVVRRNAVKGGGPWYQKEINIKFIKAKKENYKKISNYQLIGLLKLCLLKEIASKLDEEQFKKFSQIISCIMRILKNGYIETGDNIKETIKQVLQKVKGSNIINFSNYVDEEINTDQIKNMIKLLDTKDLKEINDISYRLSKYNNYINFFSKEFEKAIKESIFEFSVISLVIMEREDFEKFEQERQKCPNRVDKILFHGTSIEPISCILTGLFNKSVDRCYQHGKGVYFTDFLDYCWFYGGDVSNRANKNKIPELGNTFTLIACSTYYNKKGFRKVTNSLYTPKKN